MAAEAATTSTTNAVAVATAISSPFVHAVGGSLGSALALLLFYPLERARIELQAQASTLHKEINEKDDPSCSRKDLDSVRSKSSNEYNQDVTDGYFLHGKKKLIVPNHHSGTSVRVVKDGDDHSSLSSCTSLKDQQQHHHWQQQQPQRQAEHDYESTTSVASVSAVNNASSNVRFDSIFVGKLRHLLQYWLDKSRLVQILWALQSKGELYKGMAPILSTIFTSQFIFFFLHAYIKRLLRRIFSSVFSTTSPITSISPLCSLLASCLAGIGNVLITNPLWVTNMAIVTGETETQNLGKELWRLYQTRGLWHLWDGISASILLVSNPVIQFFCYEQFKQARLSAKVSSNGASTVTLLSLDAAEAFLIAALAKGIATILTYPLQLAQTLLRLGNKYDKEGEDVFAPRRNEAPRNQQYKGTIDCLMQLYQIKHSVAPWYTGIRAKLLQSVLTAAFTFLTYEQILGAVQTVMVLKQPIQAPNNNNLTQ